LNRRGQQIPHPHQVVCSRREGKHPADFEEPSVPGFAQRSHRMMHCGGGDGPNQFNAMAALERWRESNVVPNQITAMHVTNGVVDTIRPLCPYPQVAMYNGSGSAKDAANFACRVP
jgi:Tannase and feruloyl esterase